MCQIQNIFRQSYCAKKKNYPIPVNITFEIIKRVTAMQHGEKKLHENLYIIESRIVMRREYKTEVRYSRRRPRKIRHPENVQE